MAMTGAERQRRFRHRKVVAGKLGDGSLVTRDRLDVMIDGGARYNLEVLARLWGVTLRAAVERVVAEARQKARDTDPHAWDEAFQG